MHCANFNALVETDEEPKDYGQLFDTISICLSKGLGAPVGSVLLGDADTIKRARRVRKVFGGGMRQAGYLAAAGIYALDHNIARLAEGLLAVPFGPHEIRFVTHLDFTDRHLDEAVRILRSL